MKKLLISFFFIFILTSCGISSSTTTSSSLTLTKFDNFNMQIPVSWVISSSSGSSFPSPKEGKIEAVISSKDQKDGFINNLIIISKDLENPTTSIDFMLKNNPKNYTGYEAYNELSSTDFLFTDGEKSKIYVFEAKYNKDNSKLKFIQTAHICDTKKIFFLTMGLSLNIKDTTKYEDMLKSFECK